MLVKITVGGKFTNKYEILLTDEIKHKFSSDMEAYFVVVDDIPREMSGKYNFIGNKVKSCY